MGSQPWQSQICQNRHTKNKFKKHTMAIIHNYVLLTAQKTEYAIQILNK